MTATGSAEHEGVPGEVDLVEQEPLPRDAEVEERVIERTLLAGEGHGGEQLEDDGQLVQRGRADLQLPASLQGVRLDAPAVRTVAGHAGRVGCCTVLAASSLVFAHASIRPRSSE